MSKKSLVAVLCLVVIVVILCMAGARRAAARQTTQTSAQNQGPPHISTDPGQKNADQYLADVEGLFNREQFDALDKMAQEVRASKSRFRGGGWKLHTIYAGLTTPVVPPPAKPTDEDWKAHLSRLQRWIASRPGSITPRVALADSYTNFAWKARGDDTADKVTEEGWRSFEQRIALAKKTLDDASALSEKCPHWYDVMIDVALAQSWSVAETRELLSQGLAYEPDYQYLYSNYTNHLLPKWGGEDGDVESYADEVSKQLGSDRGDYIYFVIASAVSQSDEQSFRKMSWPKMQQGYAVLEKQYGTISGKMNEYAYMATRMGDADIAQKMFARIGSDWDEGTWISKKSFDDSKAWADDKVEGGRTSKAIATSLEENAKNPKRVLYSKQWAGEFNEKLGSSVKTCMETNSGPRTSFQVYVRLDAAGKVAGGRFVPDYPGPHDSAGPIVNCMFSNLAKASFSPPPSGQDYWVTIHLPLALVGNAPSN